MKSALKRFMDFLLFGNIYVAFGAACLVQSSIIQLQLKNTLPAYTFLVFFSSLFVYNFQRVFYKPQQNISLHSIRRIWIFNNAIIIKTLAVIGFIGVSLSFFYVDKRVAFYLSPLLILCLAYFAPIIKLRKNPYLKLFTLVSVWTIVTAAVPILLQDSSLTERKNILHICVRFCFMLAICIPFDMRDLKIDEADAISTIPHLLGENRTRWLVIAFMILYDGLIIMSYYIHFLSYTVFVPLLAAAFVNTILVALSTSKRSEYFYVAGIDGTMILQGVLLILLSRVEIV